jgi:hypothetical protein
LRQCTDREPRIRGLRRDRSQDTIGQLKAVLEPDCPQVKDHVYYCWRRSDESLGRLPDRLPECAYFLRSLFVGHTQAYQITAVLSIF